MDSRAVWNVPNVLSLSRLPLAAVLCGLIAYRQWDVALVVFAIAAFTDWLDGWWARRYGPLTAFGRAIDPLTDKVLIGSAFIYLIPDADATGIRPWIVAVVIGRELLVTGIRGIVEAGGKKFGADWFGKLKTVLQFTSLIGVMLLLALRQRGETVLAERLEPVQFAILMAMVAATVGSGVQYGVKAVRLLR